MAHASDHAPFRESRSVGTAYLLWIPSMFGVAGLHRFYTGHWGTGLLWLFTGGLCGVGSVVDLFLIPEQVRTFNRLARIEGHRLAEAMGADTRPFQTMAASPGLGEHQPAKPLGQRILALARLRGVRGFTVNDAVLELGHPPENICRELERLMQVDCLHVTNDVEGRVIYREP